jgi:hypothetical protein
LWPVRTLLNMSFTLQCGSEALHYKPEGCGFESQWGQWNFSICLILPVALWPWSWLRLKE